MFQKLKVGVGCGGAVKTVQLQLPILLWTPLLMAADIGEPKPRWLLVGNVQGIFMESIRDNIV